MHGPDYFTQGHWMNWDPLPRLRQEDVYRSDSPQMDHSPLLLQCIRRRLLGAPTEGTVGSWWGCLWVKRKYREG